MEDTRLQTSRGGFIFFLFLHFQIPQLPPTFNPPETCKRGCVGKLGMFPFTIVFCMPSLPTQPHFQVPGGLKVGGSCGI